VNAPEKRRAVLLLVLWLSIPLLLVSPVQAHAGASLRLGGEARSFLDAVVGQAPEATATPDAGKGVQPTATSRPSATVETTVPMEAATPQPDGSIVHIVQAGQVMWSIALAYEVPLSDLYALNGMDENSVIYPGDTILVRRAQATLTPSFGTGTPQPSGTPSLTPTLTVRPTRTLRAATSTSQVATPAASTQNAPVSAADPAAGSPGVDVLLVVIVVLFALGGFLVIGGAWMRARRTPPR